MTPPLVVTRPATRPHRERHLPVKLLDYTGIPAHLVNGITADISDNSCNIP